MVILFGRSSRCKNVKYPDLFYTNVYGFKIQDLTVLF